MLNRQDEAAVFRQSIPDQELRDAVMRATTEVFLQQSELKGDFDMLFFCKVVARFWRDEQTRRDEPEDKGIVFG